MHSSTFSPARLTFERKSPQGALPAALLLSFLLTIPTARAQESPINWEVGVSNQYFDYEETSSDGTTLNTERGWLPGFYVSTSTSLPKDFQLAVRVSRAKGTVDYEGMTQAGSALSTDTIETLTRVEIELTTPLPEAFSDSFSGIFGLSHTRWNRKIQPSRYSSNLYEHYRWYELSGGLRHCSTPFSLKGIEQLCITAKLTRTEFGTMIVRLEDLNLGNPELNLGGGWGGEASLKLDFAGPVAMRLYTKTWNHGASKPVVIQQANQQVSIREPASQSWLTGVELGLKF